MSRFLIALAPGADATAVRSALTEMGAWTRSFQSEGAVVLQIESHSAPVSSESVLGLPGVASVFAAPSPHPLLDRNAGKPVDLGRGIFLGEGHGPVLFAGPCGAESPGQVDGAAAIAAAAGARVLRGGAFKPRTSPYSFQGHGLPALQWLANAASTRNMALCTELLRCEDAETVATFADVLQIGSRNMQNYALLAAAGRTGKPVLLKRAMSADIGTWLLAGEHLLNAGAAGVVFCERGIIGLDGHTRNLLDLGAVAVLKHQYGQVVIADPSHAMGRVDLIAPMAAAALAAGADGVMVETHPAPGEARSDGPQALDAKSMVALGHQLLVDVAVPTPSVESHPAAA